MEQFKANNYSKAVKELGAKCEVTAEKLSETINHKDRKMYHSILLRFDAVQGAAKNNVRVNIVKNHAIGFDKLVKNYTAAGADQMIVLHDPSLLDEEEPTQHKEHQLIAAKEVVTAEQKAENEKEFNKRVEAEVAKQSKAIADAAAKQVEAGIAAGVKAITDAAGTGPGPNAGAAQEGIINIVAPSGELMENGNVEQLTEYCNNNGIDLTGVRKKDDIKTAITVALDIQKNKEN